jgi:GTP-binding protein
MVEAHPPRTSGKILNFFFMTQVATRPPHFVIMTNRPQGVPEAYQRYLLRELRSAFSFQGTPVVLEFKARKKKPFHA